MAKYVEITPVAWLPPDDPDDTRGWMAVLIDDQDRFWLAATLAQGRRWQQAIDADETHGMPGLVEDDHGQWIAVEDDHPVDAPCPFCAGPLVADGWPAWPTCWCTSCQAGFPWYPDQAPQPLAPDAGLITAADPVDLPGGGVELEISWEATPPPRAAQTGDRDPVIGETVDGDGDHLAASPGTTDHYQDLLAEVLADDDWS